MWDDIDARLRSADRLVRLAAWNEIRVRIMTDRPAVSSARCRKWAKILDEEEDEDIERCGVRVMILVLTTKKSYAIDKKLGTTSVGDWLLHRFKQRSVVLRISDPRRRLRDESALFFLGQRLPESDYPHVTTHSIALDAPEWGPIEKLNPQAVFLMGRLALYGAEALRWWSPKNPRIRFPARERNPAVPVDELDPDYHGLLERLPDGSDKRYQAEDTGPDGFKKRKDYAMVQRHLANYGTTKVVVVNCAGTSSLGTLAAVKWAASDLVRDRIELPESLDPGDLLGSRMEALLEVTADVTNRDWAPNHIELLKLYVDNFAWSKDDCEWRIPAPSHVKVLLENGAPDRPHAVLLDGIVANMKPTSQIFRLAVRLAQKWLAGACSPVSVQELADEAWIWGGRAAEAQKVGQRLDQLKSRYLRESMVVVDQHVQLLAEVAIEPVTDAKVNVPPKPEPCDPNLQPASGTPGTPAIPPASKADGPAKRKRNPR